MELSSFILVSMQIRLKTQNPYDLIKQQLTFLNRQAQGFLGENNSIQCFMFRGIKRRKLLSFQKRLFGVYILSFLDD